MFKCIISLLLHLELSEGICSQTDAHTNAVQIARDGDPLQSLSLMDEIVKKDGWNDRLLFDYVVILAWAKKHKESFDFFQKNLQKHKNIPPYVIESIAETCFILGKENEAQHYYSKLLNIDANSIKARVMLARIALAQNNPEIVPDLLKKVELQNPRNVEVLQLIALAYRRMEIYMEALRYYNNILDIQPKDKEALGGQTFCLNELGLAYQALKMVDEHQEIFDEEFKQKVLYNKSAVDINWGRAIDYPDNNVVLSRAINDIDAILDACQDPDLIRKLKFNLIVALSSRQFHEEATAEYEQLISSDLNIENVPIYVLEGVGDSYLYQRKLEQSKQIFKHILERDKTNRSAIKGFYYSLLENEELVSSVDFIDGNSRVHRPFYQIGDADFENPDRGVLEEVFATAYFYTDQLSEAEDYLLNVTKIAPLNNTYRELLGKTYLSRGLPRTAQREFNIGLATSSKNIGLQSGYVSSLIALNKIDEAEVLIADLKKAHPENFTITRLEKELKTYKKRELNISMGYDKGSGPNTGSGTFVTEARLFSQPLTSNVRAFVSTTYQSGKFQEGKLNSTLIGAGFHYRNDVINLLAEINNNQYKGVSKVGSNIEMTIAPNDNWSVFLRSDINSRLTPGRALTSKINSNFHQASLKYYKNESFEAVVSSYLQTFNKNNNRWVGVYSYLRGRFLDQPSFKLDIRLDLGTRKSKTDNVPYFSPLRDYYVSVSPAITHRLYRNYNFSFKHILTPSIGNYWQKNYKSKPVYALTYEHTWERANLYSFAYGVTRKKNIYDGKYENSTVFFANFNLRF